MIKSFVATALGVFIGAAVAYQVLNPYTNDRLHSWAQDVVFKAFPDDKHGSADICFDQDNAKLLEVSRIDPTWSHVINACAIITGGAEW